MNDEPIDLSPLDPSRDARRWQSRIDSIVVEALRARQQRLGLTVRLQYYSKPALVLAAALALVTWAGAAHWGAKSAARSTSAAAVQPASNLLEWAANDEVPSASEVLQSLGVQDVSH